MSVQKSPAQREPEKSLKKLRKEFEKNYNNLGKKLKLKESSEKKLEKQARKKLKKGEKNSMLVQNKLYVSKKVPLGERLKKKLKKSCERSLKKIEKFEKKFWQNLKKCWKNR